MRYSLLLNNPEIATGDISEDVMASFKSAFDAYAKSLEAAGILLAAEIFQPSMVTTTVTTRNGHLQVQDGPFANTRRYLREFS
jgi:hypothetical protein